MLDPGDCFDIALVRSTRCGDFIAWVELDDLLDAAS